MKAVVAAFNQEKALVGAFSVIVQPVVEPMDRFTALQETSALRRGVRPGGDAPVAGGAGRGAGLSGCRGPGHSSALGCAQQPRLRGHTAAQARGGWKHQKQGRTHSGGACKG